MLPQPDFHRIPINTRQCKLQLPAWSQKGGTERHGSCTNNKTQSEARGMSYAFVLFPFCPMVPFLLHRMKSSLSHAIFSSSLNLWNLYRTCLHCASSRILLHQIPVIVIIIHPRLSLNSRILSRTWLGKQNTQNARKIKPNRPLMQFMS